MFFFFCFSVTSDDSCLVSLRRMARVCLDRRSRGRYLRAVSGLATFFYGSMGETHFLPL